jgi:hypothetical protein
MPKRSSPSASSPPTISTARSPSERRRATSIGRRLSGIKVRAAARERWRVAELRLCEHDGDVYYRAVEVRFVHGANGGFGVGLALVEDVGCSAVCSVWCSNSQWSTC